MTTPLQRSPRSTPPGALVISLDFELVWGMRDLASIDALTPRMRATREAIPRLLDLFCDFGVHATWATVGLLFCDSGDEARSHSPRLPQYANSALDPAADIADTGANEREDPVRLAGALIDRIAKTPGQEVGTHTFSHMYCLEPGVTAEDFTADIAAAREVAAKRGTTVRSLVFPRNQCGEGHPEAAAALGVDVYRGNPDVWMYAAKPGSGQTAAMRLARLADAYVPVSGMQTVPFDALPTSAPFNIPATRFYRPYSRFTAPLEPVRLRRVDAEIRHAAKHGHLVHLWWHPHNFGADQEANFAALRHTLATFSAARKRWGMRSLTMSECADLLATRATPDAA